MFIERTYNTGETNSSLKEKYNPEGSELRKIQSRLLDMLLYLRDVCHELNIPFYLDGGTLLGAVRHGGFIPWDDDLDVVINVKDKRRLCRYLLDHPHPEYILQIKETDHGYFCGWPKIRDKYSKSIYLGNKDFQKRSYKSMKYTGLALDIFPYSDHVLPISGKIIHGLHQRINRYYLVSHCIFLADCLYFVCFKILKPIANNLGLFFCNKKTIAHDYLSHSTVYRFKKDKVYPLKPIKFEGHEFMAPNDTDYYLRILYNDYMELPPERDRHHHELKFSFMENNNP